MALEAAALFHQQDLFGLTINGKYPNSSFFLETLPNNNNNIITTPDFLPPYYFKDEIVPENYDTNFVHPTCDSCFLENPQFDCQFSHDINYHEISNLNNENDSNIIVANNSSYYTSHDEVGLSPSTYDQWGLNSSSPEELKSSDYGVVPTTTVRPRRRRARVEKNKEDIENQRMTHIAVERNRRKQMNEYLNVLRSLMPDSYVQRGDQASIVGGAINFVKELEQNLQCLSAKKHLKEKLSKGSSSSLPFKEFFTFPQYSSSGSCDRDYENDDQMKVGGAMSQPQGGCGGCDSGVAADVEVTVVESHANLKIRLQRPPKQLSKLVSGLLSLRLSILHLNVNTADGVVLYTFSLKVEDDSKLSTVDEIAGAVYKLLGRMQEDQATFNC